MLEVTKSEGANSHDHRRYRDFSTGRLLIFGEIKIKIKNLLQLHLIKEVFGSSLFTTKPNKYIRIRQHRVKFKNSCILRPFESARLLELRPLINSVRRSKRTYTDHQDIVPYKICSF